MHQMTGNITVSTSGPLNKTGTDPEDPVDQIFTVLWSLIILFGVFGNGLVIFVLFCFGKRTATNVYIMNLAFADLMFIIFVVLPTLLTLLMPSWIFGDVGCKFVTYMLHVSLQATCLILTAMSIDRYHTIVNPLKSMKWRSAKVSSYICLAVWGVSSCINIPIIIHFKVTYRGNGTLACGSDWPTVQWEQIMQVSVVLTTFIIPITVISICYGYILDKIWKGIKFHGRAESENETVTPANKGMHERQLRQKKRGTRMVAIMVSLFAFCWLPIHLISLWMCLDPNFPKTDILLVVKLSANTLSYFNSCVNPIVYAFINDSFKKVIVKKFPCCNKICKCKGLFKLKSEAILITAESNMIDKADGTRQQRGIEEDLSSKRIML